VEPCKQILHFGAGCLTTAAWRQGLGS
jgi:hypothetical protein